MCARPYYALVPPLHAYCYADVIVRQARGRVSLHVCALGCRALSFEYSVFGATREWMDPELCTYARSWRTPCFAHSAARSVARSFERSYEYVMPVNAYIIILSFLYLKYKRIYLETRTPASCYGLSTILPSAGFTTQVLRMFPAITAAASLLLVAFAGLVRCLVRAALDARGEPPVILARLGALDAGLVGLSRWLS